MAGPFPHLWEKPWNLTSNTQVGWPKLRTATAASGMAQQWTAKGLNLCATIDCFHRVGNTPDCIQSLKMCCLSMGVSIGSQPFTVKLGVPSWPCDLLAFIFLRASRISISVTSFYWSVTSCRRSVFFFRFAEPTGRRNSANFEEVPHSRLVHRDTAPRIVYPRLLATTK